MLPEALPVSELALTVQEALELLEQMPEGRDRRKVENLRRRHGRLALEDVVRRSVPRVEETAQTIAARQVIGRDEREKLIRATWRRVATDTKNQVRGPDGAPLRGSLIAIVIGAAVGAIVRYLITKLLERHFGEAT